MKALEGGEGGEALRKTVNSSNRAKAMDSLFNEGERKEEGKPPPFILNLWPRSHHSTRSPGSASLNPQLEEWGKDCALLPDRSLKYHLGFHGMAPRAVASRVHSTPPKSDSEKPTSHRSLRSNGS